MFCSIAAKCGQLQKRSIRYIEEKSFFKSMKVERKTTVDAEGMYKTMTAVPDTGQAQIC